MAEPLVVEAPKTGDDFLTGTSDEFSKRIQTEKGFYQVFEQKMNEGKVKIVDANTPVETPVVAPIVEAKPEVKVDIPTEEEITVKIKKSDLKGKASINDLLKSYDEGQKFVEHLKSQVTELNTKIGDSSQSKAEIERLKNEKVELEKKISSAVAVPTSAPVNVQQATALLDIKLPTFDNLNNLTDEQLQEKLYEAENMKKMVEGVRQTSKIVDYAKTLEDKIGKLEARINETSAAQAKMSKSYDEMTNQTQDKARVDGIFNNIGELQNKFDDLKTKVPMRDIDSKYTKFAQDLGLLEKKYDPDGISSLVDKFFNDPSSEGDALRQKAEALGVRPPEEVDKYLAIRKALDISEQNKLSLDEAYALHQYKSGGINKLVSISNSDEARKRQNAIDERSKFAKTADSAQTQPEPITTEADETQFRKYLSQNIPFSEVKKNPEMKRLYDKFYGNMGTPVNWDKF